MNLTRSALYSSGFGLCAWSLVIIWFSLGWAAVTVITAMAFLTAAGYIERIEDECGYGETIYGGKQ